MSLHLYFHDNSELAPYGFNRDLLWEDIECAQGRTAQQCSELSHVVNVTAHEDLLVNLEASHRDIYLQLYKQVLKAKPKSALPDEQEPSEPEELENPDEHGMEIDGGDAESQGEGQEASQKASPKSADLTMAGTHEDAEQSEKFSEVSFCPAEIQAGRPRFDLVEAIATVQASQDPSSVYPPYVLAASYRHLVAEEYMSVGKSTYTDTSGRVFDLRLDYQQVHINTADFLDVREEDNLRRSLLVHEQCGGKDGYLAISKVKDHGWVNSASLTYVVV
jgi:hypothetical protein